LSDQRRENGTEQPHDIRMWCLGNEMDGPWQIGHMSADDYGKLAARTASAMKMVDPGLELVVCGSSGSGMPTFGEWERVVLEHTYDHIDYISCHAYYQERKGDLRSFLASSLDMEFFIRTVVATADHVQHKRKSDKVVNLSFDEWNIWYLDEHEETGKITEGWPYAPRLLEDVYSVADAVVFGSLLITLLKNSDRVASASLAQLVNVIAPIMTEPGGAAWRQTTFFPFSATSRLASGRVVAPAVSSPTVATEVHGDAPAIDAVATVDDATGRISVFFVNRSVDDGASIEIDLREFGELGILESIVLQDDDPYAKNTLEEQERVVPRPIEAAKIDGGVLRLSVPPVAWGAVHLG
jgi:alpha-N-arabinofuranosidase